MGPISSAQNVGASHRHLALAIFAGLRSVGTVVTAVLTWLTIWHFSETPFPLFYGWTFALVFLTLGSAKAVACSAPTTRVILALWRWGGPHNSAPVSSAQSIPVAAQPLDPNQLPQHMHLISPQAALRPAVRLLKFVAATVALALLFAACMVVHGGAVLADWHLARCYYAMASAPTKQARERLARAQHSATECSVTLALMFVAPAVAIKWALVMFLGDFSWIPVLSTISSSISYAYMLSSFSASTFIHSRIWTFKQRALGVAAAVAAVMGQFLWRLAARSFLVLKFGGETFFLYTVATHLLIVISIVARSRKSRHEYRELFASNRIQVFLLTLHGSALACDFPTFFNGLKSRQAASRPDWLRKLIFCPTAIGMLTWRVLEGVVIYIVILTVHTMAPCSNQVSPEASWYQVCAPEVVQKMYIWRPKCWGCSMFDRYYVLGDSHERQAILMSMLLPAGLLLLITLCGLLGLRRLLHGCLGDGSVDVSIQNGVPGGVVKDASLHEAPVGTVKRHQLDESEWDDASNASDHLGTKDVSQLASGTVSGRAAVSSPLAVVCPSVLGSVGPSSNMQSFYTSSGQAQSVSNGNSNNVHPGRGSVTGSTSSYPCAASPAGLSAYANGSDFLVSIPDPSGVSSGSSSVVPDIASCSSYNMALSERGLLESITESQAPMQGGKSSNVHPSTATLPVNASSKPNQPTPDPDAASIPDDHGVETPSGRTLLLRALALMWLVVVCDIAVFNCHWLVQLCFLLIGVLYTSWVHVAILFERDDKRRQGH